MINEDNFNALLHGTFSDEEYAAWNAFCKENVILSNALGHFSILHHGRLVEDEAPEDGVPPIARRHLEALSTMTVLYRFAFDLGLPRGLNLMMMQAAAVDRQSSPVLQGRLLTLGIQFSQQVDCPLHLLWFLCRFEEWLGDGDYVKMMGGPQLDGATGEERERILAEFEASMNKAMEQKAQIPDLKAKVIETIVQRVRATQASDFDAEPGANHWWSGETLLMIDMSSIAYWPAKEIEDIFSNADPQEWRLFESFLQILPEEHVPPHLFHGAERFRQPKYSELHAQDKEAAGEYLHDMLELSVVYVLFRNFCHPLPNKMLLLYICQLEHALGQGLGPRALIDYLLIRVAFDFRVPAIHGLWALDLMRQVLHKIGHGPEFGRDMQWLHAEENKLLKRLEMGDFLSDA